MPANMLVNDTMRMRTSQKALYVLSCFHNRYVVDGGQNYKQDPLILCLKCSNDELRNTIPWYDMKYDANVLGIGRVSSKRRLYRVRQV